MVIAEFLFGRGEYDSTKVRFKNAMGLFKLEAFQIKCLPDSPMEYHTIICLFNLNRTVQIRYQFELTTN